MAKVDALFHPIRMRVIVTLVGRALTAQELLVALGDVAQATLYRHLKTLENAGLIVAVEERQAHSNVEKVYALASPETVLTAEDMQSATSEDHVSYFAVFLGVLLHRFQSYVGREGSDFQRDGVGYRDVPLNLSDAELRDMVQSLNTALLPYLNLPDAPDRKRRIFSTILIPE